MHLEAVAHWSVVLMDAQDVHMRQLLANIRGGVVRLRMYNPEPTLKFT